MRMRRLFVGLFAALLVSIVVSFSRPIDAQESSLPPVYFLASQVIDVQGASVARTRLFGVSLTADMVPLSVADVDVNQYCTVPSVTRIAYVGLIAGNQLVLDIVDPSGATAYRVSLEGAVSAALEQCGPVIWVSTINSAGFPALHGYDVLSSQLIGERIFSHTHVDVDVDPTATYALAFHAESGTVNLLHLPDMASIPLTLSGYVLTPPKWSPTDARFLMGAASMNDPHDLGVLLVNAATTEVTRLDTPDYTPTAQIDMNWSEGGSYIVMTAVENNVEPATALIPSILNVASGISTPLNIAMAAPRVISWSMGDTYALVQGMSQPAAEPVFGLFDPASSQFLSLNGLSSVRPLSFAWSPAGLTLGVLAQTIDQPGYTLLTIDAATQTAVQVMATQDIGLEQASLGWSSDGGSIFFSSPVNDPFENLLQVPNGVFMVDLATQQITRLSGDNVAVEPASLYVNP